MSRRVQENIVAFLFLFFFIAMIILSLDYSPRARMVPIPIASVSAVIILIQIYLMNFKKDFDLNVDPAELLTGKSKEAIQEGLGKDKVDEVRIKKIGGGREFIAILIVLVYLGMSWLIGIMAAMFLFVFGFFFFITKIHWIKALLIALITEVSIYILFVYILEIQFYEGWLINLFLG